MKNGATVTSVSNIRFDRRLAHPIDRVWMAITDGNRVAAWLEYPTKIDLRIGGNVFVDFSPEDPIRSVGQRVPNGNGLPTLG